MERAGFLDRIGRENVVPHLDAALDRARQLLGLPPAPPRDPHHEEKQRLELARSELSSALVKVSEVLDSGKKK
jgi:SulP family sulfate permease